MRETWFFWPTYYVWFNRTSVGSCFIILCRLYIHTHFLCILRQIFVPVYNPFASKLFLKCSSRHFNSNWYTVLQTGLVTSMEGAEGVEHSHRKHVLPLWRLHDLVWQKQRQGNICCTHETWWLLIFISADCRGCQPPHGYAILRTNSVIRENPE